MKLIASLLPGCILLLAAQGTVAQNSGPRDFPSSQFVPDTRTTEKKCRRDDSDCDLRIAMKCTYRDENGLLKNCMDNSSIVGNRPFLVLSKDECRDRESITATIVYTACNENDIAFKPIPVKNEIRFRKDTSVKPSGWDDEVPAKTCRQYSIVEKFDLCKMRRVMELQFDGDQRKDFPRYCRCFLYKQSYIELFTPSPTKVPTKAPTPSPTKVPTKAPVPSGPPPSKKPSMKPSAKPSYQPSMKPSVKPSLRPSGKPSFKPSGKPSFKPSLSPSDRPTFKPSEVQCDEGGVIITEIVSPFNYVNARYIELYFGKLCGNHKIVRQLIVIRWKKDKKSEIVLPLKGYIIPEDGFLVLCVSSLANVFYGPGTCDVVSGPGSPPDCEGTDTIQIVELVSPYYIPIDIYGRPTINDPRTDQDFTGGRVVRKLPFKTPSPFWNKNHWYIIPGRLAPKDNDPRVWVIVILPPPPTPTPPVPTPTPPVPTPTPPVPTPTPPTSCKYFFTEFGDPVDNRAAGFIEIRVTCPGAYIPRDLYVYTWKFPAQKVYLYPVGYVPADGYIIICRNKHAFETEFTGKVCDIEKPEVHPEGIYSIALYKEHKPFPIIIDIYGIPEFKLPKILVFLKGRAYRKLTAPFGKAACAPKDWYVIPGAYGGTVIVFYHDPREWKEDPLRLFFTEFADPSDQPTKRFIELHSPNKRNFLIEEEYYIFKHDPGSGIKIGHYYLKGSKLNGSGFIVLCSSHFDRCTEHAGWSSIIDSAGTFVWTLQICENGPNVDCKLIDSYGVGCYSDGHSYEDGRAVRKIDAQPKPSPDFYFSHWCIFKGVTFSHTDPGEWNGCSVVPAPAPTPTYSKGKGKGKKKYYKKKV